MKSNLWWIQFPQSCSAGTLRFCEPVNEQTVREEARNMHHIKRLPRGTQIWPGSDASIREITENNVRQTRNTGLCASD